MFQCDSICLRVVEENDLELMRQLRNDPSTWINLTDIDLIDAESQRRWFRGLAERRDRKYFVVCDDDHPFLGIVRMDEIDRLNRSIRVGCDIVPTLRGRGYGTKAFTAILKYCFDFLNMHRVWLAVLEYNQVARRLYERQGFRVEGRYRAAIFRDGRYHDYLIMSILEEEYRGNQRHTGT
ncbi:MAG: GNAT family N-acetyltransferase [Chloroflexi bacterium]|nr:GNAT family N-acetyltransferase [Chloroflexota bacterium]